MEVGIPVTMLGIALLVVGAATYHGGFDTTIGVVVLGLGVLVAIVGLALWRVKGKAPATVSQAAQPPKP